MIQSKELVADYDLGVTVDTEPSMSQQFPHCKRDEPLATVSASASHGTSLGVWLANGWKALLLRRHGRRGLEN